MSVAIYKDDILLFLYDRKKTLLDLYDKYCELYNENDLIKFYNIELKLINELNWDTTLETFCGYDLIIFIETIPYSKNIYDSYQNKITRVRNNIKNNNNNIDNIDNDINNSIDNDINNNFIISN